MEGCSDVCKSYKDQYRTWVSCVKKTLAFDAIAGEAVPIKITAEETCPTPELDGVTNCPLTLAGPVFRCRHSLLVMFTAPKFQERSGEEEWRKEASEANGVQG